MSKRRCELSAAEINSLHEAIDRQLERVGLETQPKVALRLMELVQDPEAQLKHYVDAIKTDWSLTGRLLRLANSAFYAQRAPVTKLDRALVVLGLERTKAITLGFYLSRAASSPGYKDLSRKVWGESVYRASLCAALAKRLCPNFAAEAFIVGLMLDSAQPLMAKLLGDSYVEMRQHNPSPVKLFAVEFETLEYTHVDVAAVMMKRWKMPALLAKPIVWHHTLPPAGTNDDPAVSLQRMAYYAGAVQLGADNRSEKSTPLPTIATRLFDLEAADIEAIVKRAGSEYAATVDLFSDVAERCGNPENLADDLHRQLVELMDEQMCRSMRLETRGGTQHLMIAGQRIELEPGRAGDVIAFIAGTGGERLMSCTIDPLTDGPDVLCNRLGLDHAPPAELDELMRAVRSMAA